MQLAPVPLNLLWDAQHDIARWLGPVASRPGCDLSLDDMVWIVMRREGQLIAVLDDEGRPAALGLTQVRDYADGVRSCWVLALGGQRAGRWSDAMQQIEAGARRNGCHRLEFVGRRAWKRLLPDFTATPCDEGLHYTKLLVREH